MLVLASTLTLAFLWICPLACQVQDGHVCYQDYQLGLPHLASCIFQQTRSVQGRSLRSHAHALCRLLGIEPDWQRHLFEFYQAMLEAHIAQLRREQKYDDGIVDVKGSEISIVGQPQVSTAWPCLKSHPLHGAVRQNSTLHCKLNSTPKSHG